MKITFGQPRGHKYIFVFSWSDSTEWGGIKIRRNSRLYAVNINQHNV